MATEAAPDLESLSSPLRQGWRKGDLDQAAAALSELSLLYPDLLVNKNGAAPNSSYYETLKLNTAATQEEVVTNFFRQLRKVLKDKTAPHHSKRYTNLLDAGFILRKPRLRLSYDLAAVSDWLSSNSSKQQRAGTSAVVDTASSGSSTEQPLLLKLLEESSMITTVEIQALLAQMKRMPKARLDSLVLNAGYVTKEEMASLKLAKNLLSSGQVALPQILVALYDERHTGTRMAESLQTRGWLPI